MPRYTFCHRETDEEKTLDMKIAEMEEYLVQNPEWFVVINPIGRRDNFVSGRHTNMPIDGDFKNLLDNIKKANPGSTVDY